MKLFQTRNFLGAAALGSFALLLCLGWELAPVHGAEERDGFARSLPICQEVGIGEISDAATNLLIRVNKNLEITDASGETISTLSEWELGGRIPVYYVTNMYAADALAKVLADGLVTDAIVCSNQFELVARMREKVPVVRGMLDCRRMAAETREDWIKIRDTVNRNSASVALLPGKVSAACIEFLRKLSLAVWVDADPLSAVAAAGAGAAGILCEGPDRVRETLETLPPGTQARPLLIAHRALGDRQHAQKYGENTLEASEFAVAYGADLLEIDVYLTADNRILVTHDLTYNGHNVEEKTLAEIRKLGGRAEKMPLLGDFFEKYRGTDVNIFIEIKGNKEGIVSKIAEEIEAYGFDSQCSVISFKESYLRLAREAMPHISLGLLDDYNRGETAQSILKRVNAVNATFNPGYAALTEEAVFAFAKHGVSVWPWTFRDENQFSEYARFNVGGLTLDDCIWAKNWAKRLIPEEESVRVRAGENFALGVLLESFGAGTAETLYSHRQIGGDVTVEMSENGSLRIEGEGTAYIVATFTQGSDHASPYTILSPIITIRSEIPPSPGKENTDQEAQGGCGSTAKASVSPVLSALFLLLPMKFRSMLRGKED